LLEAHIALLEIEMAKLEEIFLPFLVTAAGTPFFEATQRKNIHFESGNERAGEEVVVRLNESLYYV
jgi:hypothetical protein